MGESVVGGGWWRGSLDLGLMWTGTLARFMRELADHVPGRAFVSVPVLSSLLIGTRSV